MAEWTTIDPIRCGYIRLPKHNEKDTPIAKYINRFRKAVKKHLFAEGTKRSPTPTVMNILIYVISIQTFINTSIGNLILQ
jgi:hypothetical protein